MSFEENHIGKSIKSKMDNFEIVPPEDVWDNIESALLKNKAIIRRNRIIGATGIVIVLALMVYTFLRFYKNAPKQEGKEMHPATKIHSSDSVLSNTDHSAEGNMNKKESFIQQKNSVNEIESKDENKIDTVFQTETANLMLHADTIPQNTTPAEKVVIKKVIKKPVYIVQQDTIYKVDTLSKKKKR